MDRVLVIVNPAAGSGRSGRRWPVLDRCLRDEGAGHRAAYTERPGHATELARDAVAAGFRTVIVAGGDGTLDEVVNGLVEGDRAVDDVTLGILPLGTSSDFARSLGTLGDPLDGARHLARRALPRRLDVGRIDCWREGETVTRYFVNVAGCGLDGEVAAGVNRSRRRAGGSLVYPWTLFRCLAGHRSKRVVVTVDGESREGTMTSIIVANGHTFGGGMRIAPAASWDDGLLDVIALGDFTRAEIVWNLPRLYRGTHLEHAKVTALRGREVRVEAGERLLVEADGESIGETPATFRLYPGALRVLV